MDDDRLPTAMLVSAQIRQAATQGISIIPLHKGDPTSGVIVLKINTLDGNIYLFSQSRDDEGRLVWRPPLGPDPLPENEADAYMARQTDFDPDVWTIEVEDKQGRLWFPGPIVAF